MKTSVQGLGATLALIIVGLLYAKMSTMTIKGSDTMVILAQRWAERYMVLHPEDIIQVTGGGSGTGISALINGTTDICAASRPMTENERSQLMQRTQSPGVEIKVAKDALSVYVSQSNPVNELSLEQINRIYTGKITNWKEVGGGNASIVAYGRESSSGTYIFFRDTVLNGKDYMARMQSLPGTAAVVNAVARDKYGIGYGGAAYSRAVKPLRIKENAETPGVAPTVSNVKNGSYPISRFLYLYVRTRPIGPMKKYIDWVLSPAGQEMVTEVGYFPVK